MVSGCLEWVSRNILTYWSRNDSIKHWLCPLTNFEICTPMTQNSGKLASLFCLTSASTSLEYVWLNMLNRIQRPSLWFSKNLSSSDWTYSSICYDWQTSNAVQALPCPTSVNACTVYNRIKILALIAGTIEGTCRYSRNLRHSVCTVKTRTVSMVVHLLHL